MSRPRFTCDHCGREVALHADVCPGCGKHFDAVRCPRCGHQDRPGRFEHGCPSCGYLANPPSERPRDRTSLFGPTMTVLVVFLALAIGLTWLLRAP